MLTAREINECDEAYTFLRVKNGRAEKTNKYCKLN